MPHPQDIPSLLKQAIMLQSSGRVAEAEVIYRQALSVAPENSDVLYLLGRLLCLTNRCAQAADFLRRAVALDPNKAEYYAFLAAAVGGPGLGRCDEAIAAYRKAIELDPNDPGLWMNLGNELRRSDGWPGLSRADEAHACFCRAMELNPNMAAVYQNAGSLFATQGHHQQAMEAYRRVVELDRNDPRAHWDYCCQLMRLGHFREGWEHFEWRIKVPFLKSLDRHFPRPQWDGSEAAGKTVLLHAEGGHGDALHFVRCVPSIADRNARLILECHPALVRLFEPIKVVERVIARGQELPEFDFHLPLQGLPRILGITLSNIPNAVPYLSAPLQIEGRWSRRLGGDAKFRVGLSWAGSWTGPFDNRSRDLSVLAPLVLPGVKFFGLQKGPEAVQTPPAGMDFVNLGSDLTDFAETAAVVKNLDLVISVDTSVAHLAGALGRPIWVLIPFHCDFRWLEGRSDSPWYPTMRLFRQPASGDWSVPVMEMARTLRHLAGASARP